MGVGGVGLGKFEVTADHFEGGVAEEALEGVDVSAVAEVVDGEGVAKAVGVGFGDAGAFAEGLQVRAEGGAVEGVVLLGDEDGGGGLTHFLTIHVARFAS